MRKASLLVAAVTLAFIAGPARPAEQLVIICTWDTSSSTVPGDPMIASQRIGIRIGDPLAGGNVSPIIGSSDSCTRVSGTATATAVEIQCLLPGGDARVAYKYRINRSSGETERVALDGTASTTPAGRCRIAG